MYIKHSARAIAKVFYVLGKTNSNDRFESSLLKRGGKVI